MNVLRVVLMIGLQALLLEAVSPFGQWTRPQWALWAILMLPPQWGPFAKLLTGFGFGVGLDIALGTYGQHMVAGTLLGGLLPGLHRLFAPREGYEVTDRPVLRDMGANWVIGLTLTAALVYHLAWMFVETWHPRLFSTAIFPAITSALWTTLCCLLLHLLTAPAGGATRRTR